MLDDATLDVFRTSLKKCEVSLNLAYKRFEEGQDSMDRDFYAIKLQCCIFQFDLNRELLSVLTNRCEGLAEAVALKGLVHKLFEYESLMRTSLRHRIMGLASSRGIVVNKAALDELDAQSKPALKQLRKWVHVRNKAAGHYDSDIGLQVEMIRSLKHDEVIDIALDFIKYNMGLLIILRDTGLGRNYRPKSVYL